MSRRATISSGYEPAMFIRQDYYLTWVLALHNFDGTLTDPSERLLRGVMPIPALTGVTLPVITGGRQMNGTEALQKARQFNAMHQPGAMRECSVPALPAPVGAVPALRITGWSMSPYQCVRFGNPPM